VIAVSAGNHAQGVAFHALRMQLPAVIVAGDTFRRHRGGSKPSAWC